MADRQWTGCRILVTRPAHQAQALLGAIGQRGGEAFAFPTVEIGPPADRSVWERVATELETFDWLVFVSANAVSGLADHLRAAGRAWPYRPRYAAIGRKTAAAAEQRTCREVLTPPDFRSESFLALPEMQAQAVAGRRFLLVRGEGGRELLPRTLEERGAKVVRLGVYTRRPPAASPRAVEAELESGGLDAAVFTSPQTFTSLLALLSETGRDRLRAVPLVVISPVTGEAVTKAGFPPPIVAPEASDEGILQALDDHVCHLGPNG